jgi:hypothetical protein
MPFILTLQVSMFLNPKNYLGSGEYKRQVFRFLGEIFNIDALCGSKLNLKKKTCCEKSYN